MQGTQLMIFLKKVLLQNKYFDQKNDRKYEACRFPEIACF